MYYDILFDRIIRKNYTVQSEQRSIISNYVKHCFVLKSKLRVKKKTKGHLRIIVREIFIAAINAIFRARNLFTKIARIFYIQPACASNENKGRERARVHARG